MGAAGGSSSLPIDERLVARLWDDQYPFSLPLKTTAGRALRVVYRGRRRFDRGPDFPGALIALEDGALLSGDVEVHVNASDWRRHGHHRDPNYNGVILHVVLFSDGPEPCLRQDGESVPVVELARHLARPLAAVARGEDGAPRPSPCLPGSAASPELGGCLESRGMERFEERVRRYESELACLPPDEVLYRGIADALGYSHNREPFGRLAELLPLERLLAYRRAREGRNASIPSLPSSVLSPQPSALEPQPSAVEALLLGAAGLLPSQRAGVPTVDSYAGVLEKVWRRDGGAWAGGSMRAGEWRFFRVRPANFPTRRVAALAALASRWPEGGLAGSLAGLAGANPPRRLPRALESLLLGPSEGGYWRAHADFGAPLPRSADLVGRGRAAEIAVNLLLPFLAARASSEGMPALGERAREAYRLYPKRGDNEITRYLAAQITGAPRPPVARSACRQQGLLHVFRLWCEVKRCGACPVGAPTS